MSGGSWTCDGCGAVHGGDTWACHLCGHARSRPDAAPLLPPAPAGRTAGTRLVVALGAIAVLVLAVSIVVMAAKANQQALAGRTGTYPVGTPAAAPAPAGMFAAPADPMAVIDRASAQQVLDTFWETRRRAIGSHDVALLRSVAEGPTAEWEASCGCTASGTPTGDDRFTAPPQSEYPIRFLAERTWRRGNDTASPAQVGRDLIVFVRRSATEPWKAVIDASAVGGTPWDAVGGDPFAMEPQEVTGPVPAVSVPDALAAYFQSWWDRGESPSDTPVDDAGMVRARGQATRTERLLLEAEGATTSATYRSGYFDDGLYEFWGVGGRLVCSTVRWVGEQHAGPGGALEQPADRSVLPAFLPPGRYASVSTTGVRQFCATLRERIEVEVMAGGDTTATYVTA